MKINKHLEENAIFDPTKKSVQITLRDLMKNIEKENMTLPIFQTFIRWTLKKSVSLLNFQLNGYAPVSPISVNVIDDTTKAVPQLTFLERKWINEANLYKKESVNDGQQRLSCNYKAYIGHPEFRNIVLDLSKGIFIINPGEIKNNQIPVTVLYNKDDKILEKYIEEKKYNIKTQSLLVKVRNKFLGYSYTVNYAFDLTKEQQANWFDVLNLAGSRVTEVEVKLVDMLMKGVDFYSEYADKFVDKLTQYGFGDLFEIKATEISIPLACLNPAFEIVTNKPHSSNFSPMPSDVKPLQISKLEETQLREAFSLTLIALDSTLNFIDTHNLPTPSRVDYITYLVGAFVYNKNSNLTKDQELFLLDWYSNTFFTKLDNGTRREIFTNLIKWK